MKGRYRILLDKPFHKTYCIYYDFDGNIVISGNVIFYEYDPNLHLPEDHDDWEFYEKNRSAVVFHELEENYQRTEGGENGMGLPSDGRYSQPGMPSYGKKGAHDIAKEKEKKIHERSRALGAVEKIEMKRESKIDFCEKSNRSGQGRLAET